MFHRKKKKETLPTWSDMSIKQFDEISKINPDSEDAVYEYLAIINNTTLDDILERPVSEVMTKMRELEMLKSGPGKKAFPKKEYTINGREYTTLLDMNKMTTAQYIDFQMLDNYEEHIPEMLSIFLVPKGCTYNDGYEVADIQKEIYEHFGIEDALTLAGFFLTLFSVSTKLTLARLKRELRKLEKSAPTPEVKERIAEARRILKATR